MSRTFEDKAATRERVPVLIALAGASGSGKTFSALRLASGIQRVSQGSIFVIDTEARRSLHYADKFKFQHVVFEAPFGPLDYLDAIQHCVKKGATTIVIDSMSHEHEGPGGVLEMHENLVQLKSEGDPAKAERVKMGCWGIPKAERRRLINTMIQMPVNFVLCFRAKDKIKPVKGGQPEHMGWMPIAGEEFVFEMTLKCLLLPGSNGIPVWESNFPGEQMMIKIPEQFKGIFASAPQLTEDVGEQLARWAAGGAPATARPSWIDDLCAAYDSCSDPVGFERLERDRKSGWSKLNNVQQKELIKASSAAAARVKEVA